MLRAVHFISIGAFITLLVTAFVLGYILAPAPVNDTPQQRDAIALVTANIGASVSNYDLEWDDPPHVLSVKTVNGDSVVLEELRMSTNSYSDTIAPKHMRFVIRGVVSAKNWLRSLKVISHKELKVPKPDKR